MQFDLPRTLLSEQAELKRVDNGTLSVRVSEEAVRDRWGEELAGKGLKNVKVDFLSDDRVEVTGELDLKIVKVPVAAAGRFIVDGSDRVQFKAADFAVGGTEIGLSSFKDAVSLLTPVVDLGKFRMYVNIDEMRAEEGYLVIKARSMSEEERRRRDEANRLRLGLSGDAALPEDKAGLVALLQQQLALKVTDLTKLGDSEQAARLSELSSRLKVDDDTALGEAIAALEEQLPELKQQGGALLDKLRGMIGKLTSNTKDEAAASEEASAEDEANAESD